MQSLIRKKKNKKQATEILIKESLLCQLSYTVKEVQLLNSQTNEVFRSNEACNSLIVVLESIFLHGLKRGILRAALTSVGGVDETKPQPSFWSIVSNYTHKDSISTIRSLSQITTDVGRCRVWIRIALNQTELTSYFQAMEKDRRPVSGSYQSHAFLRDREMCDTASKLLEGIVAVQFDIPINSSILNVWSNEPLMLSGVWSPPIKTPVSKAVDVAEGIEDDEYDDDDASSIKTSSSVTTLSTILALDENQALRMILETPIKKLEKEINAFPISTTSKVEEPIKEEKEEEEGDEEQEEKQKTQAEGDMLGNSLSNVTGWSSLLEEETKRETVEDEPRTYSSLLESYGSPPKNVDYRNILKEKAIEESKEEAEDTSEYEILSDGDLSEYEGKLFRITRETGLKDQKYICANCQLSIGLNFAEARLCYLSGEYFCDNCHLNETSVIPSRLVFNWDHKKYPVCSKASRYIAEISHRPLIDIKKVNPRIYSAVEEMKELRLLRFQLNMLRAYLHMCRVPVILDLQKKVWPREYVYEHVHLYSINDLIKVPGGTLAAELNSVVSFARDHVTSCWLCSQKGFICEVCKNPKVIYPFDCSSTYRCSKCHSVYHEGCLLSSKNCPKCKRRQRREISPDDSADFDDSN